MPHAAAPVLTRIEHLQPHAHSGGARVLGIGTAAPRLSWMVPTAAEDYQQDGYEVEVTPVGAEAATFVVDSPEQVLVPWPAPELTSRDRVHVRVRVRSGPDHSDWSAPAGIEVGLLDPSEWTARFIAPVVGGGVDDPAPVLEGRVEITGDIESARLYVTAHGLYRATVNGIRVGDEELAPGWTSYPHRLRYQTHDVTDLVRSGDNVVSATLGQGWYRGRLGFTGGHGLYGDRTALLTQLEVTTTDGQRHMLATGPEWAAGASGILLDEIYDGERTDLRVGPMDCTEAVQEVDGDLATLVTPTGPPVRVTGTLPAQKVWTSPLGKTLVDFGQNLVGWVRLTVRCAAAGSEVTVRHAEVLEHDELGTRPLRSAKATDSYLLAGADAEVCEPCFTFHGFRYAEVDGVPDLLADDLEAVVVGSDLERIGWFDSSHDLLNRFHENVVWGARGNFVDVPTDCPQRDERLGWTGDIQVFSPAASFVFDVNGFLDSWLADLSAEQTEDGGVPFVIPNILPDPSPAAAAWSDASCVVPWVLYQRFGDTGILVRQLPSMRAWVDKMAALAGDDLLWTGGFQFGDWLDPTAPPDAPADAKAHPDVVATAHFAYSAQIVADAAAAVGDTETAQRYGDLAARVRDAFAAEYITPSGMVMSDAQTAYGMAIAWSLLPSADQREHAGRRLADLVRMSGFRISTGFVGTPLVTQALTEVGQTEVAYRLLLQTGCPSWLYPVTMGATTIWERWDSMLPDGTINPGEMTSFNHYALGGVADWIHRRVAGLAPAEAGYRSIAVAPVPTAALTHASARHVTPYGEAAVSWRRAEGRFDLEVTVPVGATAQVSLPDGSAPESTGAGTHTFNCPDPVVDQPSLPADATVRDVLDNEGIWTKVVKAATDLGAVTDEAEVASRLGPYLDRAASEVLERITRILGPRVPVTELRERLEPLLTCD